MIKQLKNSISKYYLHILALIIPFTAYAFTVFPSVSTEDSGELITAVYHLGIAHPPGYPLYTILTKFLTLLIPFGNIAWKVNITSAIYGSLTSLLLFIFLKKFLTPNNPETPISPTSATAIISFSAALIFSFLDITWSQSIRTEVYTLNNLLLTAVLYCSFLWHQNPKNNKYWLLLCASYGLSLTNHHMLLVFSPILAGFVIWTDPSILKNWKKILQGILAFLVPLTLYIYLPIRSTFNPVLDWGNPETFTNFWNLINRKDYGLDSLVSPKNFQIAWDNLSFHLDKTNTVDTRPSEISQFFIYIKNFILYTSNIIFGYIKEIFNQSIIIFIIATIGLHKKNASKTHYTLIVSFIFYIVMLSNLIDTFDSDGNFQVNSKPFILPALLIASYFTANGLLTILKKHPKLSSISLILPSILLFLNFTPNNQHNNYIVYDLNKTVLNSLPENSNLYIHRDESLLFGALYLQKVENFRPDIQIYSTSENLLYPQWPGLKNLSKAYTLLTPPTDSSPYKLLPKGLILEIVPPENYSTEKAKQLSDYYLTNLSKFQLRGTENSNLDLKHRTIIARIYQNISNYIHLSDENTAINYLQKALDLLPQTPTNIIVASERLIQIKAYPQAIEILTTSLQENPDNFDLLFQLGIAYKLSGNTPASNEALAKAKEINRIQFYTNAANLAIKANQCAAAYPNLQQVHGIKDPNPEVITARCFENLNQQEQAIKFYQLAIPKSIAFPDLTQKIENKIKSLQ